MLRNLDIWLPHYLLRRRPQSFEQPTHVLFCFVDHYEPLWGKPSFAVAQQRVQHWVDHYPLLANQFRDADGRPPQHTFFFPAEEYQPVFLDPLARLCHRGYGEVEIHLHHRNDTAANLATTIETFKSQLRSHGFLTEGGVQGSGFRVQDQTGPPSSSLNPEPSTLDPRPSILHHQPSPLASSSLRYAFIHGNWALDNSRRDGDWCGVNNELQVLRDTGCYADFTLPSAPSDTQTRKTNSIYYATDDPLRPKSHDTGIDVCAGGTRSPSTSLRAMSLSNGRSAPGAEPLLTAVALAKGVPAPSAEALPDSGDLMLVQGPLALNWRERKWGVLPHIEHADVAGHTPVTPARIDLWVRQRIGVIGKPDWVFVKVHTHGCQERNFDAALGEAAARMHTHLQARYNDGRNFILHYVTAREFVNLVKAAEAGLTGPPDQFRDFLLPPPPVRL